MTPASKGAQVKRAPASRSAAPTTSRAGNKKSSAKVEATATKRSAPTKKKAAPVVKKAATAAKKAASSAKKSTVAAPRRPRRRRQEAGRHARRPRHRPRRRHPAAKKAAPAKKAADSGHGQEGGREARRQEGRRRPRWPRPTVRRRRRPGPHDVHAQAEGAAPGAAQDRPLRQGHQVPRRGRASCCTPTAPSTRSRRPRCGPRRTRWRSSASRATSSSTRSRARAAPSRSTGSGTWPSPGRPLLAVEEIDDALRAHRRQDLRVLRAMLPADPQAAPAGAAVRPTLRGVQERRAVAALTRSGVLAFAIAAVVVVADRVTTSLAMDHLHDVRHVWGPFGLALHLQLGLRLQPLQRAGRLRDGAAVHRRRGAGARRGPGAHHAAGGGRGPGARGRRREPERADRRGARRAGARLHHPRATGRPSTWRTPA